MAFTSISEHHTNSMIMVIELALSGGSFNHHNGIRNVPFSDALLKWCNTLHLLRRLCARRSFWTPSVRRGAARNQVPSLGTLFAVLRPCRLSQCQLIARCQTAYGQWLHCYPCCEAISQHGLAEYDQYPGNTPDISASPLHKSRAHTSSRTTLPVW